MHLITLLDKQRSIRAWLSLLIIAFVLPSIIINAYLDWDAWNRQRSDLEHATLQTARALLQGIDRELASAQGASQALARSPFLKTDDLATFYAQAQEALRDRPGINIVLSDRGGRQIFNTLAPFGQTLPPIGNQAQALQVFKTGNPAVSNLYIGSVTRLPRVSVEVPVLRDGQIMYVLSMEIYVNYLSQILRQQRLPDDWVVAILDSSGVVIARNPSPEKFIGSRADPAVFQHVEKLGEGSLLDQASLEGIPMIATFSHSQLSKWTIIIGVPKAELNRDLWAEVTASIAGELLYLTIGLVLARAIGKRITAAIRSLVAPAIALGTGEPVQVPSLQLQEANDVGQALNNAAILLKTRTVERDRAEKAEREIRLVKQQMDALYNRLTLATKAADIAIWEWDVAAQSLMMDQRMLTLYRIPSEKVEQPAESVVELWRRHVHPDDIARLEQEAVDAIDGKRSLSSEFRIIWPDGQIRIIRTDAIVSYDNGGQALRMTGINMDITDSKQQQMINAALREKETMLKELYHRVKNNLQVITSLFNLQAHTLPDGAARIALQEAADRVRAMALVHEKFYQSSNLALISLDQYIVDLCRQLGAVAAAEKHGISLQTEVEPLQVSLETAIPLGLILNELISNSLKHAFPTGGGGQIVVRLHHLPHGEADPDTCPMLLIVSDNGIGIPPEFDRTSSATLGLRLIEGLTAQLNGKFSLETKDGTYASLHFSVVKIMELQAGAA